MLWTMAANRVIHTMIMTTYRAVKTAPTEIPAMASPEPASPVRRIWFLAMIPKTMPSGQNTKAKMMDRIAMVLVGGAGWNGG